MDIKNETQESARQQRENGGQQEKAQNKRRRYPPKKNDNQRRPNPSAQETAAAAVSAASAENKPKPRPRKNTAAPAVKDGQQAQGQNHKPGRRSDQQNRRNQNGRRRPQIHYNDENITMLPNNYREHYEEDVLSDEIAGGGMAVMEAVENTGAVVGRNAVRELLRSNRSVDKVFVRRGDREGSIVVLVAEAVNRHIPVVEVEAAKLDALSGGAPHQGVVAMAAEKEYTDIENMLAIAEQRGEAPLIVIADEIADPYNLGALIRCAECAGAHGLVIPKRRAAGLTPAVTKASAGAIEHLAIAKVTNIALTLEQLKKKGLWIYAAEAGGTPYYETDFKGPAAIVFGSEGNGIGKLIMSKCDFVVSIPLYGHVNSLNVSTAASVILCHAARMQRQN